MIGKPAHEEQYPA